MNFLRRLALQAEELDDSSRLDVVEIAGVALCASEFVSFLVGLRTYQHTFVFVCMYIYRDKAVPLPAWRGPEFSRKLRFPYYKTIGT